MPSKRTCLPVPPDFDGIPLKRLGGAGPEWLYRIYGEALMYIGITNSGTARFKGHRRDQEWWPFVQRIEIQKYGTRREVRLAEVNAIAEERPTFNIADRGAFAARAAGYTTRINELEERLGDLRRHCRQLEDFILGVGKPDWTHIPVAPTGNVVLFPRRLEREYEDLVA